MKRLFSILFLLSITLGVSGVNVRDFSARGGGKQDDTAAFQKANAKTFLIWSVSRMRKSS